MFLVPKTILSMDLGAKNLKHWVLERPGFATKILHAEHAEDAGSRQPRVLETCLKQASLHASILPFSRSTLQIKGYRQLSSTE